MVDAEGRLVLPVEIRQSLGLEGGGELPMGMQGRELCAMTRTGAIAQLEQDVPARTPGDPLWSEEFIAERRAEAKREAQRRG
jgi:hypothetical protein